MAESAQFFGHEAAPVRAARQAVEAAVFRTITDADWARELALARRERNDVRAQIQERLKSLKD